MKGISEIGVLFCGTCCVVYSDICHIIFRLNTRRVLRNGHVSLDRGFATSCVKVDSVEHSNIRLNRLDMIGYDWILTMPCS